MKLPVYDSSGAQVGEMELPEKVFGAGAGAQVLHQVVVAELAARRQGTANTKSRGEVAGSNRKLWRQKGTGRARVGDRRPPNRRGGGRPTGPRARSYRQRTPRGMKQVALRSALEARAGAGEVRLMAPLELAEAKTRELSAILEAAGGAAGALLVLGQANEAIARGARNLPGLRVRQAAQVSSYEVLVARQVIITTDAVSQLEARVG